MKLKRYLPYKKFLIERQEYVFARRELVKNRVYLYISYRGFDVIANDHKHNQWYYTYDDKDYYGPYASQNEARRAYDRHKGP